MKEYVIDKLEDNSYNVYLLCLTFDSVLNYLEDIEKEAIIENSTGEIIIDQLLSTGNSKNRFISCQYNQGTLDLSSAKNISPTITVRKKSQKELYNNYKIIANSILNESQLEKIRSGTFL